MFSYLLFNLIGNAFFRFSVNIEFHCFILHSVKLRSDRMLSLYCASHLKSRPNFHNFSNATQYLKIIIDFMQAFASRNTWEWLSACNSSKLAARDYERMKAREIRSSIHRSPLSVYIVSRFHVDQTFSSRTITRLYLPERNIFERSVVASK